MSYLNHPLDWTSAEVPQLRDLFVMAYGRPLDAMQLAASAGIAAGTFPIQAQDMRTTWTELLNVMALQGKLRIMVEIAAEDPLVMAYWQGFQEMLEDQPAVAMEAPGTADDWWMGADMDEAVGGDLHLERLMEKRSQLFHIALARQVAHVSRSVAKLHLRFGDVKGYGTGFLIQPDLILTNQHNVSHQDHGDVSSITAEFDHELAFVGEPLVRKANVPAVAQSSQHDWAVVQLEQVVDREPIALGTPFDVGRDDTVIIIQHPLGNPKQFALDPLSVQHADDNVVQYLADTQSGSSGSPVFNVSMHAIALHRRDREVMVTIAGRKETVWRNEGVRIERVTEGLEAHGIEFESN